MKFIWSGELLAPDGMYTLNGTLYAESMTEVIEQVRQGFTSEFRNAPLYTGQRVKLTVSIENVPTN